MPYVEMLLVANDANDFFCFTKGNLDVAVIAVHS